MEDSELINNFATWKIIKDISITNIKEEITSSELAKEININKHNPYFRQIINHLINKKIISITREAGQTRLFTINIRKLDDLIENSSIYSELADYIHNKKLIYSGI